MSDPETVHSPFPLPKGHRILLVDDTYIAETKNLHRTVYRLTRHPATPLIVQDRPWECHKNFRYYPSVCMWSNTVLHDPETGMFKMWYGAYCDLDPEGRETGLLLYAESRDGLNWVKPNLGTVEWNGSRDNNIVLVGLTDGGEKTLRELDTASVIYRPDEWDPMDRYRLLVAMFTAPDAIEGVWLYRSGDGLNWQLVKPCGVPEAKEFNCFFWDDNRKKFIGTVRVRRPQIPRRVGYTESRNFTDWMTTQPILAPENMNTEYNLPGDDVYGLCSFPYESHYLGFLHTHHTDRRLEVQLMASPDARTWNFVGQGEYVLPNDPPGGYGQGMISTMNGSPIRVGNELWVYIGLSPKAHNNPAFQEAPGQQKRVIGLATIRLDGFAALVADDTPGTFTTRAFVPEGDALFINARANRGKITAEILGDDGRPLPGLSAAECLPIEQDEVNLAVRWKHQVLPQNRPIQLRFHLQQAGLYSFWCNTK